MLRAEALNTLEAFTYRARDHLEDETFIAASTESIRKALEKQLGSTSDWLYGDGADAKVQDFKDKLKSLQSLVDPVLERKTEALKRPDAIKALKDGLESLDGMIKMVTGNIQKAAEEAAASASSAASSIASSASASSTLSAAVGDDLDDDPYSSATASEALETEEPAPFKPYEYTTEDLSLLTTKYEAVKAWLETKLALQDKLGSSDDPAFLASESETKAQDLQKAVTDMIMRSIKMQDIPRKPKSSKKVKSKSKSTKSKAASETASKATGSASPTSSASASSTKSIKDEL